MHRKKWLQNFQIDVEKSEFKINKVEKGTTFNIKIKNLTILSLIHI